MSQSNRLQWTLNNLQWWTLLWARHHLWLHQSRRARYQTCWPHNGAHLGTGWTSGCPRWSHSSHGWQERYSASPPTGPEHKRKKSKFRFQDLLRQKWQQQVCESNCLKVQVWIEMKYKSESKGAHLRASSVVVQTGEAGEVLFGDGGSRLGCNQTVGVGRISHNQHLKTHTHTKTELI